MWRFLVATARGQEVDVPLAPEQAVLAPARDDRGLRVYGSLVSFFQVSDALTLDLEYRAGPIAVSVGGGAGGLFIPHVFAVGAGARGELHGLIDVAGHHTSVEVALGGGPMWGYSPLTEAYADGRTSWSFFPSGFVGLRREGPRGVVWRVGMGLNSFAGGALLSIGHLDR